MNRLNEIEARLAEIPAELEKEGADLGALKQEVTDLKQERAAILKAAEERQAILDEIGEGVAGTVTRSGKEHDEERAYDAASPEYRTAFLKTLQNKPLSTEERAAFTHTTANTSAVLPTTMLNEIWSLIEEEHPILQDVRTLRTGTIMEIPIHQAIAAGDAKETAEGSANADEQNTTDKIILSGKDFSKSVDISYAQANMSIDAFEQYLITEISDRLGAVMADHIVGKIEAGMNGGNKVTSSAAKKTTYTELAGVFALLKRAKNVKVYATRKTIYTYLVGLVDSTGRPIFQVNAQDGAEGMLIGGQVKIEDSVADNKFLIGDPKKVPFNLITDIMIESDRDIKKHVITHSGYARGEAGMPDPFVFAELDIKQA